MSYVKPLELHLSIKSLVNATKGTTTTVVSFLLFSINAGNINNNDLPEPVARTASRSRRLSNTIATAFDCSMLLKFASEF